MFRGRGQRVTGCGKGCNGGGSTRVNVQYLHDIFRLCRLSERDPSAPKRKTTGALEG